MFVKMLTHIHMVVYTWWCWHIYKGGGVCRGNEVRSENELVAKMLASVN